MEINHCWKAKIFFQSSFMLTTVQPFGGGFVEGLVELADGRFAVVGILALGVGVVDDEHQACAGTRGRPLQHLLVAVGVAKCSDGATADVLIDADGFAGTIVDEVQVRQASEIGFAINDLEFGFDGASDDLLWWNPIRLFSPGPHKFDSSAGDDVGFEAIGSQISEEFNHGLIDALVIRLVILGICRGGEPVGDNLPELFYGHSAVGSHDEFAEVLLAEGGDSFPVALENCFEGLLCFPLGMAEARAALCGRTQRRLERTWVVQPRGFRRCRR